MIGRVLTAYRIELIKAMRSKFTYIGPVLVALMVCLSPLMFMKSMDEGHENGYRFIAFATPTALNLLGLFLLLSFCASLVSSETGSGTIRLLVTRPLFRHEFIIAKLLTGLTYALTLSLVVAIASWAIALRFGVTSGVEYGGEMRFTSGQMVQAYVLGFALSLAPQFAFVSYAVMISTLLRGTAASVVSAIGIWLLIDAVKYPLHIDKIFFASHVDTPWKVFAYQSDGLVANWGTNEVYGCLATSLIAAAIFTGVAIVALHRRNLHA